MKCVCLRCGHLKLCIVQWWRKNFVRCPLSFILSVGISNKSIVYCRLIFSTLLHQIVWLWFLSFWFDCGHAQYSIKQNSLFQGLFLMFPLWYNSSGPCVRVSMHTEKWNNFPSIQNIIVFIFCCCWCFSSILFLHTSFRFCYQIGDTSYMRSSFDFLFQ